MSAPVFRRPSVRIVLLGTLVALALYLAQGPSSQRGKGRIVEIQGADVVQLQVGFARTWQRAPTLEELKGLLDAHIREEVLYREAIARGYDRDDPIVRRAMQRKMEFLGEARVRPEEITDDEVRAYFTLRPERYRLPAELSFEQVYFNVDVRGDTAEPEALKVLAELRRLDPAVEELGQWGDRFLLAGRFSLRSEREIQSDLGTDFAKALLSLETGSWQGPVPSSFGLHLVKVTQRTDPELPPWQEIRESIVNDMAYEARRSAKEQLFQEIVQGYEIVISDEVQRALEG